MRALVAGALLLLGAVAAGRSQAIPAVHARALSGAQVVLPEAATVKPLLLMIGFSHKGSDDFKSWNRRRPYLNDARVDYYELVDLQGVPGFVKPMILHGMRKAVPTQEQPHFAPFYSEEDQWKRLVHYADPAVAYVILADPQGRVVWQGQGPSTDAKTSELESAIAKLASSH